MATPNGRQDASATIEKNVHEFFAQALATEFAGVAVYETAIHCAQIEELEEEWRRYLDQTEDHIRIYTGLMNTLGINPAREDYPSVVIVRKSSNALVNLMTTALNAGDLDAAQIVAAECIALAETKCHLNWELVGELGKKMKGPPGDAVRAAYDEVSEQENEHLFHTTGWARELWIQRLGMPAVIPPPEEEKHVKTAIGAERAKNARTDML